MPTCRRFINNAEKMADRWLPSLLMANTYSSISNPGIIYIIGFNPILVVNWFYDSITMVAAAFPLSPTFKHTPKNQWRSVTFVMREDDFCPYFYYSMLADCHSHSIHPGQCNIDRFRLLHDTHIFRIPIMRLLQPSLGMEVYNRLREKLERTDSDTFSTAVHTLACI